MSRFLVTSWPLYGHVLPKLAVAAALRERGHEVAFYTGDAVTGPIEAEGFERFRFERVDEDAIAAALVELETSAGMGRPSLEAVRRCFDRCLVDPIPGQVEDVGRLVREWGPDVIVNDVPIWGPMVILAETTQVPVAVASGFLGPAVGGDGAPPQGLGLPSPSGPGGRLLALGAQVATDLAARRLRKRVDALRAAHGLGPMGHSVNEHIARLPLTLIPGIPELDYGRHRLPPGVEYVGACPWRVPAPPGAPALPAGVREDRRWVHVAASTMAGSDTGLLRAAVEGLAGAPYEVVVSASGSVPADLAGASAPNVHLAGWVDHGALLGRCSAVVTPGGAGTIVASVAAGVPLVVVPSTWDKPDNARRVVEAGVGVRLSPRRCTPERLRAAVDRVLSDPTFRDRALDLRDRLAQAPGPVGAAGLLERLAGDRAATTTLKLEA